MTKLISTINFALGYATLALFVVWTQGDIPAHFSASTLILFAVGCLLLVAAGLGIGRLATAFHGIAATLFMCWGFYTLKIISFSNDSVEKNLSYTLRALFSQIVSSPYLACLIVGALVLVALGTRFDNDGQVKKENRALDQNEAQATVPAAAAPPKVIAKQEPPRKKIDASAKIDPRLKFDNSSKAKNDETPIVTSSASDKKRVIRCPSCKKKIKVQAGVSKIRCPMCREVMKV